MGVDRWGMGGRVPPPTFQLGGDHIGNVPPPPHFLSKSRVFLSSSNLHSDDSFVSLRNRYRLVEMGGWAGGRHNLYSFFGVHNFRSIFNYLF